MPQPIKEDDMHRRENEVLHFFYEASDDKRYLNHVERSLSDRHSKHINEKSNYHGTTDQKPQNNHKTSLVWNHVGNKPPNREHEDDN